MNLRKYQLKIQLKNIGIIILLNSLNLSDGNFYSYKFIILDKDNYLFDNNVIKNFDIICITNWIYAEKSNCIFIKEFNLENKYNKLIGNPQLYQSTEIQINQSQTSPKVPIKPLRLSSNGFVSAAELSKKQSDITIIQTNSPIEKDDNLLDNDFVDISTPPQSPITSSDIKSYRSILSETQKVEKTQKRKSDVLLSPIKKKLDFTPLNEKKLDIEALKKLDSIDFALKYVFNYDTFRYKQKEIIISALNKKDIFVLMPTGGGKSICYELPSLLTDGITVVITPLISLLQDQVLQLLTYKIPVLYLSSSQTKNDVISIMREISNPVL